jgi:glycosyltransferase involved in cell wall biosynthesis
VIRLLFISTGLGVGGAEISLLQILQHLDRTRFAPQVVSLTGPGDVGPKVEALGIPVRNFDLTRRPLADLLHLYRLVREFDPHLVQTWMYHADLLGGLAARLAGVRQVVWGIRNSNLDRVSSGRGTRAIAWLCARLSSWLPRAIVSCSHVSKTIHKALGYRASHFTVIGNGFDLAQFHPDPRSRIDVRRELGVPATTPLVVHVGRYHAQKNHAGLVRAAAVVLHGMPDVHFVLVGKDVDHENCELADAVVAADATTSLHLLGLRDDTARLIAASDVLVLSSRFGEAFPRVLGEALACGVPCVATDVGDSRAIVGDCGRIVRPDDDGALAQALIEMLSLPLPEQAAMSRRARARAVDRFDIAQVARQYESFYMSLLKESHP